MDKLEKEVHNGTELVAKKKIDRKFLGAGRKPYKNAKLWGLDMESKEIYEIEIQTKKVIKFNDGIEEGTHKVYINPDHPSVWALNKRVALKKFLKIKYKI